MPLPAMIGAERLWPSRQARVREASVPSRQTMEHSGLMMSGTDEMVGAAFGLRVSVRYDRVELIAHAADSI